VKRVLFTGTSGTGESIVIAELAARGYTAVDTDDDGRQVGERSRDVDRLWREDRIRQLLATEDTDVLFVSGTAANQIILYRQFDYVALLSAPTPVIVERLASRSNTRTGSSPTSSLGFSGTSRRSSRCYGAPRRSSWIPAPRSAWWSRPSCTLCGPLRCRRFRSDVVQFAELTAREIRHLAEQGCLAVVPTGCTEQQGPHLPVTFDTWLVETITRAAADATERRHGPRVLGLPALPFGPTPEHRGFGSGFIDLPRELHEAVVEHVLASLADQGFRRVVVWRGCGGHDLHPAVGHFNARYVGRARAVLPELPYHAIWCRIGNPAKPGGHADAFATSLALHLRPDMVRRELIANPSQLPVDWNDPALDFARSSPTGVIGDPTEASAELGARLGKPWWPRSPISCGISPRPMPDLAQGDRSTRRILADARPQKKPRRTNLARRRRVSRTCQLRVHALHLTTRGYFAAQPPLRMAGIECDSGGPTGAVEEGDDLQDAGIGGCHLSSNLPRMGEGR